MDTEKAQLFAAALEKLCKQHGVTIWTPYRTAPIMVSDVGSRNDQFFYVVQLSENGNSAIIRRVLA